MQIYTDAWKIRRALGAHADILQRQGSGYLLDVVRNSVDALVFADSVHLAENLQGSDPARAAEMARDALAMWKGPAFCGVPLMVEAAATWEELRLRAHEIAIDGDLALGRHHQLVNELQVLTTAHPVREPFHQQLMLALYRSDRAPEALSVYRLLRDRLVEETGTDPGNRTQRLHQQILSQDGSLFTAEPLSR